MENINLRVRPKLHYVDNGLYKTMMKEYNRQAAAWIQLFKTKGGDRFDEWVLELIKRKFIFTIEVNYLREREKKVFKYHNATVELNVVASYLYREDKETERFVEFREPTNEQLLKFFGL